MTGDSHSLGYGQVDGDEHVPVLMNTMDATASWDATIELRAFERRQLALMEGERLLDVGCGLGDAAIALGEDIGAGGEIVGIDKSAEMLNGAQERARSAPCRVRFSVGNALTLDERVASFDAVRSERTLQWVSDPRAAVDKMARVLRPGGRLSLIDTDWSTFRLDVGDDAIAAAVHNALQVERNRPSNVGSRLEGLVQSAGLTSIERTRATQRWSTWDPDVSPAPDGCFSMRSLADDLVEADELDVTGVERFVSVIHDAARAGRFSMSLTMYAVIARRPTGDRGREIMEQVGRTPTLSKA